MGHTLKIWCILSLKIRFTSSSCVLPRKLAYRWLPTALAWASLLPPTPRFPTSLSCSFTSICSRVPSLSYFPASTLCLSNSLSLEGPFLSHIPGMQGRLSPVPCDRAVSPHWSCHSCTISLLPWGKSKGREHTVWLCPSSHCPQDRARYWCAS